MRADHKGYSMNPRLAMVRERVITGWRPDKDKGRKQFLNHRQGRL